MEAVAELGMLSASCLTTSHQKGMEIHLFQIKDAHTLHAEFISHNEGINSAKTLCRGSPRAFKGWPRASAISRTQDACGGCGWPGPPPACLQAEREEDK